MMIHYSNMRLNDNLCGFMPQLVCLPNLSETNRKQLATPKAFNSQRERVRAANVSKVCNKSEARGLIPGQLTLAKLAARAEHLENIRSTRNLGFTVFPRCSPTCTLFPVRLSWFCTVLVVRLTGSRHPARPKTVVSAVNIKDNTHNSRRERAAKRAPA